MKDESLVSKVGNKIRAITLIWNYFTVATLAYFGFSLIGNEELILYAIIVFAFAIMYGVLTTIIYLIGPKKKRESEDKKQKRSILKILYKILKLCITVLPFLTFTNTFTVNITYPNLMKIISIVWLCIQIGVEIWLFVLKIIFKKAAKIVKSIVDKKD